LWNDNARSKAGDGSSLSRRIVYGFGTIVASFDTDPGGVPAYCVGLTTT
jgi:hypothetical protein